MPTIAPDIIKASWRRCRTEYRFAPSDRTRIERISSHKPKVLHGEISELLSDAESVVNSIRSVVREAGRVVLVTSGDGVVVRAYTDSAISQELLRDGLAIGAVLLEQVVGTNGIDTCLVSRQPVTVHAGAHFNEGFRHFTCAAAPIFGPDGRVVAAVGISRRVDGKASEGAFAQHYVLEAAQRISLQLFRKKHRRDCVIAISLKDEAVPLASHVLIATDGDGRILGATPAGYACLGIPDLHALGGHSIRDLCKRRFENLESLSRHAIQLNSANGKVVYVTTLAPCKTTAGSFNASVQGLRPLDRVAGRDVAMQHIVSLCRKIIDRDIPLLLLGETGVGKDTLAGGIHAESARATKPYVAVNCAAIPSALLASELFGCAPGTFTGGVKDGKLAKIPACNGGTLLLDEIGDMPFDLQAYLLRVLEERTVTPLGSTLSIPLDIKIICATHKDLANLVSTGQFRSDLYYRIRGAQLMVPALRHRTDLDTLLASIICEEAQLLGASAPTVSSEVYSLLVCYAWPGNLRELRNVIRYVLSLHGQEPEIQIEHLPETLLSAVHTDFAHHNREEKAGSNNLLFDRTTLCAAVSESEYHRISDALRMNGGSIKDAAYSLGISRSTLHRKLRHYENFSNHKRVT